MSPDFGLFLRFCRAGQVDRIFEDGNRHLTRQGRVLKIGTRHRPVRGVSPIVTGRFRSGWSVPAGHRVLWTALVMAEMART